MTLDSLTPIDVVGAEQRILLVDIRPREERRAELGYVPGSLAFPLEEPTPGKLLALDAELLADELPVFVCTSGRRSGLLLAAAREAFGRPISHLAGGVLAWRAEGYATCGVNEVAEDGLLRRVGSTTDFVKALRSCFVAEMVERSLAVPDPIDPMSLLTHCFEAEGVSSDNPAYDDLLRVIDRMGVESWRRGSPADKIAENTDRMRAALAQLV